MKLDHTTYLEPIKVENFLRAKKICREHSIKYRLINGFFYVEKLKLKKFNEHYF